MLTGGSASDKGRSDSNAKAKSTERKKKAADSVAQDSSLDAVVQEMAAREQAEREQADEYLPEAARLSKPRVESQDEGIGVTRWQRFKLAQRKNKAGRKITALNKSDYTKGAE